MRGEQIVAEDNVSLEFLARQNAKLIAEVAAMRSAQERDERLLLQVAQMVRNLDRRITEQTTDIEVMLKL